MVRTNWMCAMAATCLLGLIAEAAADDNMATDYVAPQPGYQQAGIPPLYFNHYYPAAPNGQIPARMYMAPLPIPPRVGYTYITYPPFAPHEYLWQHDRRYVRYHPSGGYTVTSINWVHHKY